MFEKREKQAQEVQASLQAFAQLVEEALGLGEHILKVEATDLEVHMYHMSLHMQALCTCVQDRLMTRTDMRNLCVCKKD
jgi:hypothetical protein